ncbi:synaptotagmin-10-like [Vespula maculifrons]|uniref:Uncharacterized protein n=4 Tax=Vespula TaxID=7451 RepID=A0A834KVN8_VESGE|nr:hypothetical protein HZH66_001976 [Vespula vulgaris]KAF7413723.1 hypothetical protein HZH68_002212 [Vespula germanica]KAF7434236.1 hypothetical protein H0235_002427 [Vespula pensylvanica]
MGIVKTVSESILEETVVPSEEANHSLQGHTVRSEHWKIDKRTSKSFRKDYTELERKQLEDYKQALYSGSRVLKSKRSF